VAEIDILDAYSDRAVRTAIEAAYYARINEQCSLEHAVRDAAFLDNPSHHVALFADHGVVHVRDIARHIPRVLDTVNGRLIPARTPPRLRWMKAYGVLLAYLHDIGMVDLSPAGRAMHPEFVTQEVLGSGFDALVEQMWHRDPTGFAARYDRLDATGDLGAQTPVEVFRESLAMANCHSKSKVPVAVLNDPAGLRRLMIVASTTSLQTLHQRQVADETVENDSAPVVTAAQSRGAFAWLELKSEPARELRDDVIDTIRALRCSDGLRQRGTALKTSGNYEVFVDEHTANAVYALRSQDGHLYLLEVDDPIAAGESNLSCSQLEAECNLRIAFHHGRSRDQDTVQRAARSAARVINDIQEDVIGSFDRGAMHGTSALKAPDDTSILIESVNENPEFAERVHSELLILNSAVADRIRVVPSLEIASAVERNLYIHGGEVDWDIEQRRDVLRRLSETGHRSDAIDPEQAFRDVRRVDLAPGETLIRAGTPSGFVYVPMGPGLEGESLGGYGDFTIRPWVLLGVTGVIRGAIRNARVVARNEVSLLCIPKPIFLKHWHFTYDQKAFAALFRQGDG